MAILLAVSIILTAVFMPAFIVHAIGVWFALLGISYLSNKFIR